MHPNFVVIRDFLISELKRPLTDAELEFIAWLAQYEQYTFNMIMHLFREVARKNH